MANVVTNAMTTNMVKVRVLRILAWRPMLSTISSTSPLHDMSVPMVKDSRQTRPFVRAPMVPPTTLLTKATTVTATT